MMQNPADAVYRFGPFEVNAASGELLKNGKRVKLQEQPFRLLVVLLENAGEVVSREQLRSRIWPQDTFVDFEGSLRVAVRKLREGLGDDADRPSYLETIPKRGYRFMATVEVPIQPSSHAPLRDRKRIALAAIGFSLAGAAALTWYLLRPLPTLRIASYTQITTDGQMKWVAGTDGSSLYLTLLVPAGHGVVPVVGGRVTKFSIDLPTSRNSPSDFPLIQDVSPDGSKLLVSSVNSGISLGTELWVVDAHGEGARFLANGRSAIWSSDGGTVLYSTVHGDLYTIPSEGGEPRLLLASPAPPGTPFVVNNLAWSPDGSRIRFLRNDRYWEVSADGKNLHEVLPNWHAADPIYLMCCGSWTPDGDFFLFIAGTWPFSQNRSAGSQIWALDERRNWPHRPSLEPVQLTTGATTWSGPVVSRDGHTLYATDITKRGELVTYDAKSKELVPYLGGISADIVTFSKDGKYLVYDAYPEGTMWRANRDGSGRQQLTGLPFYPLAPEWSPDGTQILFFLLLPSHFGEMYTVSSQGGTPKRLLPDDKYQNRVPTWSPDGKRIVFSQFPAGVGSLFPSKNRILELDTGKVTDLPPCPKPCWAPRWSPDGRYLEAMTADRTDVALFDFRTNRWTLFNLKRGSILYARWSHDGRFIYFQDSDNPGAPFKSTDPGFFRVPAAGGKAEKLVDLKGFRGIGILGTDPDDNPILLRDEGTYDVYALALERK
jgi:DNA-binding winged helix-turn-helix (wHTH) protein/Tol biopolymer transport system component